MVSAQITGKHKHNTQTRQMTENVAKQNARTLQNKTKQIRNKHRQNPYITIKAWKEVTVFGQGFKLIVSLTSLYISKAVRASS